MTAMEKGKIYTRTGDSGMTSIHGGERVPKTDLRIDALGTLDELNVTVGIVRAKMDAANPRQQLLKKIQITLMALMSNVATPRVARQESNAHVYDSAVGELEHAIDDITAGCGSPEYFILPGGDEVSAFLHQARVVARRAERSLWRLNESDDVPVEIMRYVNRLSDLFFVMARAEAFAADLPEERWRLFRVKAGKGASGCPYS
mgnify:CR=1 FL=1